MACNKGCNSSGAASSSRGLVSDGIRLEIKSFKRSKEISPRRMPRLTNSATNTMSRNCGISINTIISCAILSRLVVVSPIKMVALPGVFKPTNGKFKATMRNDLSLNLES